MLICYLCSCESNVIQNNILSECFTYIAAVMVNGKSLFLCEHDYITDWEILELCKAVSAI